MLEVSFDGFKYAKLVTEKIDASEANKLKERFDYVNIVSYGKADLKDFSVILRKDAVIDLSKGAEKIFANFNSTTRNHIRRAEKIKDLEFIHLDNNIEEVYELQKEFDFGRGWAPRPREEIIKSKIFSAYFKKKLISAVVLYEHGAILRISKIFSKRLSLKTDSLKALLGYAGKRLIFEVCKYGKENNYEILDLGGINLNEPEKSGIARFKQNFGIEIKDVYIYRHETAEFKNFRETQKEKGTDVS